MGIQLARLDEGCGPVSTHDARGGGVACIPMGETPGVREPDPDSPLRTAIERGVVAGVGLLSSVAGPIATASSISLLETVLGVASARRRQEWEQQVTDALQWLIDAHNKSENDLRADEMMDAVYRASQIAIADSTEAKRVALQNALCNVGAGTAPSRDRQAVMMRLLDEVTELHIRALGFLLIRDFIELEAGGQPQFTDVPSLLVNNLPVFQENQQIAEAVAKELVAMGLLEDAVEEGNGLVNMGTPWHPGKSITPKGRAFAEFISGPFTSAE